VISWDGTRRVAPSAIASSDCIGRLATQLQSTPTGSTKPRPSRPCRNAPLRHSDPTSLRLATETRPDKKHIREFQSDPRQCPFPSLVRRPFEAKLPVVASYCTDSEPRATRSCILTPAPLLEHADERARLRILDHHAQIPVAAAFRKSTTSVYIGLEGSGLMRWLFLPLMAVSLVVVLAGLLLLVLARRSLKRLRPRRGE
jgi:hypothetical protein